MLDVGDVWVQERERERWREQLCYIEEQNNLYLTSLLPSSLTPPLYCTFHHNQYLQSYHSLDHHILAIITITTRPSAHNTTLTGYEQLNVIAGGNTEVLVEWLTNTTTITISIPLLPPLNFLHCRYWTAPKSLSPKQRNPSVRNLIFSSAVMI